MCGVDHAVADQDRDPGRLGSLRCKTRSCRISNWCCRTGRSSGSPRPTLLAELRRRALGAVDRWRMRESKAGRAHRSHRRGHRHFRTHAYGGHRMRSECAASAGSGGYPQKSASAKNGDNSIRRSFIGGRFLYGRRGKVTIQLAAQRAPRRIARRPVMRLASQRFRRRPAAIRVERGLPQGQLATKVPSRSRRSGAGKMTGISRCAQGTWSS
jgi:hypothetical protein